MTEFFNALDKFKPRQRKPHMVVIDGKNIEVSHDKILEIQRSGIDKWMIDDNGDVVKKPIKKTGRKFVELTKAEKGYIFLDKDPFWPTTIDKGGYVWQILSE